MRKLLLSFVVLVALAGGVSACGTAASTSPTSASAKPSPTPLTDAEKATAYLLTVKKVRSSFYSADDRAGRLCRGKTVNSSQSVRHSAAKKIKNLVRKMQDIEVRFNLLEVQASMEKAHRLFGKYMAEEVRAAQEGQYSLAQDTSDGDWSTADSLMDDANGFWKMGATYNQSWYIEIRTVAKKLGIKVPWKWRD